MTKIGIFGAQGRMGKELCASALNSTRAKLVSIFEITGHPDLGRQINDLILHNDISRLLSESDAVIDFTSVRGTLQLLEANEKHKKPLVIGTTGLNEQEISQIRTASGKFPIVFSPNYSIGINLLLNVLETVGKVLSMEKGYDLEIVELHHRLKKDSPSGTALKLAEVAASSTGRNLKKDGVYGRDGMVGPRKPEEVGVFAVRAGDIIGEHSVIFCNMGERVEISHKAHSRQTFSAGAVEAAVWLKGRKPGLYSMKDVLGL